MTTDTSRYRYIPGVTPVEDIDLEETVIHDQKGQRVTESTLDAEAEGLRSRYPNLVPGGKSLSGTQHSPRFQVVLPQDVGAKVIERAGEEHMSVSRWMRRLVERELAETP